MAKTTHFNNHISEYEQWFEDNKIVYQSELNAIRRLIPTTGRGVEIGIGSGLFAGPLGICEGCDPSEEMRNQAIERGIDAIDGIAESLPYKSESFDFVLMVTTICFIDDVDKTCEEIKRILKPNGQVIVAFVDKDSLVSELHMQEKEKSVFYKDAAFFNTSEVSNTLRQHNFSINQTLKTVFGNMVENNKSKTPKDSYGKWDFVVIKATKL